MLSVGASGNNQTQPNEIASWTDDDLESPVTALEFAVYLGLMQEPEPQVPPAPDPDPPQKKMLESILIAATQAVIDYTSRDLKPRTWNYKADRYPDLRQSSTGLAPLVRLQAWWVTMPMAPVISFDSVNATEWEGDPRTGRVFVSGLTAPLEITYTAGYATVPEWARQSILAIGAYIFEHRGECDALDAIEHSIAKMLLRAQKRYVGGL